MSIIIPKTLQDILDRYKGVTPVPLVKIAEDLGIDIYETDDFTAQQSGLIKKENDRFVIYVNATHISARKRFTIAHELAHYFLHGEQLGTNNHIDTVKMAMTREDGRMDMTAEDKRMETEANALAAEILMPENEFKSVWDCSISIEDVANHFGVSENAAAIRGKILLGEIMV